MISLNLNSKNTIPQLGLGTFNIPNNLCESVVLDAIEFGYRHIDTATVYYNEKYIGSAVSKSGLQRENFFITSKFWGNTFDYKTVKEDLQRSLDSLQMEYLDLYLIHFPEPKYLDAWMALEKVYEDGLVKSIGVSNFTEKHLSDILENGSVTPSVNQIKLDIFDQQKQMVEFHSKYKILTQSWGPLGQGQYKPTTVPRVKEMSEKYGKSPYQIILRWHIQNNIIVFPKTSSAERLKENISIFDFELENSDMSYLSAVV